MNDFQKRRAIRAEVARIVRNTHRSLENVLRIVNAKSVVVTREDFLREYDLDGNARRTFIPTATTFCPSATWQDKYTNSHNHAINIHTAMRATF
jgi:hypothetical protein